MLPATRRPTTTPGESALTTAAAPAEVGLGLEVTRYRPWLGLRGYWPLGSLPESILPRRAEIGAGRSRASIFDETGASTRQPEWPLPSTPGQSLSRMRFYRSRNDQARVEEQWLAHGFSGHRLRTTARVRARHQRNRWANPTLKGELIVTRSAGLDQRAQAARW